MRVRIIVPIENIKLENGIDINLNGIKILHGNQIEKILLGDSLLLEQIGTLGIGKLVSKSLFYFDGNIYDLVEDKSISPKKIIDYTLNLLLGFVTQMWIIKDCCPHISSAIICDFENNKLDAFTTVNFVPTFSNGEMENTIFNQEEINDYSKLYPIIMSKLQWTKEQTGRLIKENPDIIIKTIAHNFVDYNRSRLARAIDFAMHARANAFLVGKVSFFICAFECLFTSSASEVTHKVCERCSIFVGGDVNNKLNTYDVLSSAYKIRSKYLHGSVVKYNRQSLIETTSKLDSILRFCVRKIIDDNDQLFQMTETEGNVKKFEQHFKTLLFSQL